MGWLYVHRPPGMTHREFFSQRFAKDDERRVVDVAAPRWSEAYVAYQTPSGVLCIAVHIHWQPRDYTFGYKDVEESMGPCLYRCPARILALLSPTADLFEGEGHDDPLTIARQWRARQPKFDAARHKP